MLKTSWCDLRFRAPPHTYPQFFFFYKNLRNVFYIFKAACLQDVCKSYMYTYLYALVSVFIYVRYTSYRLLSCHSPYTQCFSPEIRFLQCIRVQMLSRQFLCRLCFGLSDLNLERKHDVLFFYNKLSLFVQSCMQYNSKMNESILPEEKMVN